MGLELPSLPPPPPRFLSYSPPRTSRSDFLMASLSSCYHHSLSLSLQQFHFNFVLTDPRLPDHPIVFASDGFLHMTGYSAEDVLGRNCRFLQGPATDRGTVLKIRDAIREERPCQVTILNYTKDGRPFWNLFHMAPVYSKDDGRVVHFVGVQTPIQQEGSSRIPSQGVDCYCSSGAMAKASNGIGGCVAEFGTTKSMRDNADNCDSIDIRIDDDTDFVDEDTCEAGPADKEKATSSVKSVMKELAESSRCKGAGVTETRCTIVPSRPGEERVVCSSLMLSLTKVQQSFVLANPLLPDTPIVFASDLFLQLTGYSREEVVGRNCRFLQGPKTDPKAVQQIRESLKAEKPCTVRILNYRKDKTPFWNFLHIAPVRSSGGKVAFLVGVQSDVTFADEETCLSNGMTPQIKQLGAIGAVRVAVRSLQGGGLCRVQKSS
uniref:Putative LOV domain-containing protein n=1 Tax=Dipteris conjugata TaxID=32108 RepID=A0A126WZU1_9MONI|nr:putative LOV domain-containing protein [Dipteris conjugata]